MSTQEVPLGYFQGPEGDIICLIKDEEDPKYRFGKVIRFHPQEMILYRLYHKDIVEVAAHYRTHCRELERFQAEQKIEEFQSAFETLTAYRYRPEKNLEK